MRELICTHIQPNADAPAAGAHAIRIDGDRIVAVEAASRPRGACWLCRR